jgi:hypothetical protein
MRLNPKSEQEIAEEGLLPPGVYDAEFGAAEEAVSAKGNDMIKARLKVYHGESFRWVTDYLMEAMARKLRNAAAATGLLADYEAGKLSADDLVGKPVQVKIGIEKDKNGTYPDKNNILDYVRGDGAAAAPAKARSSGGGSVALDDDIPFAPEWR